MKLVLWAALILAVLCSAPGCGPEPAYEEREEPSERPGGETQGYRPYSPDSPWNLPIGPDPVYDAYSERYVGLLSGPFGCDPGQYTYPVYDEIDADTERREVSLTGLFSRVTDGGRGLEVLRNAIVEVPMPQTPTPSHGTDSQVIFVNPETGDEWGFWQFQVVGGSLVARNGYHYNIRWSGVPPSGYMSRGAGVPYLAGLVRPHEIRSGRIRHALAFSCQVPDALHVYPATRSDGKEMAGIPEGARLQLDPSLTEADFDRWGLDETGKIIARALQEYGMVLVDYGGHPKVYVEDGITADWRGLLDKDTVRPIPYSAFRVLDLEATRQPAAPQDLSLELTDRGVRLTWNPVEGATRYRVKRRKGDEWGMADRWVTETAWVDGAAPAEAVVAYRVYAVNHNGVSAPATSTEVAGP